MTLIGLLLLLAVTTAIQLVRRHFKAKAAAGA
jgi:hypothetical protein